MLHVMKSVRWMGAMLLGSLTVWSCGNKSDDPGDLSEPGRCGGSVCSARQRCDESGREPRCECITAYEGKECESCAPGHEESGGRCRPIEIDCDDNPCGLRGACVSAAGRADRCECREFHTGPTCTQCIEGYQDSDGDDQCAIGCDSPELPFVCEGLRVCDDLSGEAVCACPVGSAGEDCELCEDGYARRGEAPCYETCASAGFECAEPTFCFDYQGRQPAACVCPVGYQGDACDQCKNGFEKQGEYCVLTDKSGLDLLTVGVAQGRSAVVGIDSASGAVTPLFTIAGTPEGLVYDSVSGALYVADYQGVQSVDWMTGETTLLVSAPIGHGSPLAFEPETNSLYSHRSSGDVLFTIDPSNGATSDIASTMTGWIWDITYRTQDDTIYAVRSQGLTPSVVAIAPSAATTTELGDVDGAAAISSEAAGGLAALEDGRLALLARVSMNTEEAIEAVCRRTAYRLGLEGYEDAPATLDLQENAPDTVLSSQTAFGAELVVYRSYGGSGDNVLSIEVRNPDAFLCILTYEEDFRIEVDAGAKWAGGIIYSYQSTVSATVPDGFSSDVPLLAGGGSDADLSALGGLPDAFRVVSGRELSDRRLPPLSDFDSYSRTSAPYGLYLLSVPDLIQESHVLLEGTFRGGLSAY